ncbi:MAG: acyltransferase [Lachnospiraceae bacterium]|nr:acyltransferase [Lachnospiraceae bacterium]
MKDNSKTQKRKGLDALRGIGITGIVLYHLFPSVVRGGFLGVPLFFVLSGYLMFITSEHNWKNGDFHIGNYYMKRVKKIVPPLFTMVMVVCCYLTLTKSSLLIGIRNEICSIFLGFDNWWQIGQKASYFTKLANASPFTHLWFLAVEIQFYILWPALFLLYRKCCQAIGDRKMCFAFLALALLSAGKMVFLYTPGEDPSRVYYGTDTMAFPLFIGMFLGAVRQQFTAMRFTIRKKAFPLFGMFLPIICLLFFTVDGQSPLLYQGGMFFVSLFFACMVLIIENQETQPGNLPEPVLLSLLGKKSYGIYLWHYPLIILGLI